MTHPDEPGTDRTGFAIVKYGIILIIVIVVLFFIVRYVLPMFTGGDGDADEGGEEPVFPSPPAQTQVGDLPEPAVRFVL